MLNALKVKFLQYFENIILTKKNSILNPMIYLSSLLFRFGVHLRHFLYDTKILKEHSVKPTVVSIGSVFAGGSAKTPFSIFFLSHSLHKKVFAISRGYGVANKRSILSTVQEPKKASDIGDELFLIQQKLKIPVISGKNRLESARLAEGLGASMVVIDDGFQYRKLKKNLQILTLSSATLKKYAQFLPRGFLRDSLTRLKYADLIVVLSDDTDPTRVIRRYSDAPILRCKKIYSALLSIDDKKHPLIPTSCVAFCAIAFPKRFFDALRNLGFTVLKTAKLYDHEKASKEFLKKLWDEAKKLGATMIICTEKDMCKLDSVACENIPIFSLQMELSFNPFEW